MNRDQSLLDFIILGTPVAALVILVVSLFVPGKRLAALCGVMAAPLGFAIGAALGGGFGQTEGWGWGNVGAAILGINYGAVAVLLGIGVFWMGWSRALGVAVLVLAAVFPVAHFSFVVVRPAIHRAEVAGSMTYWRPILVNGYSETSEDSAKAHLSDEAREGINAYLLRHLRGEVTTPIPPSTLNLLDDLGFDLTQYNPLPAALAEKIYARAIQSEKSSGDSTALLYLVRNPSTPEDVLEKLADSNDVFLLEELADSKALTAPVAQHLQKSFERIIDEETLKAVPIGYRLRVANEKRVELLRRFPAQ